MAKIHPASSRETAGFADHVDALARAVETLPRALAVVGEEEFLRAEALETLAAAFALRHPDAEILTLRGPYPGVSGGDGLKKAAMELAGVGLFSPKKLVIHRNADRACFPVRGAADEDGDDGDEASAAPDAGGGDLNEDGGRFIHALERLGDSLWCWIELASLPRNRKFGKSLAGIVETIPCPALRRPAEQSRWLRARAGRLGKTLDGDAAELLLEIHGGRPGALAAELEKLSVHAGGVAGIDAAAVRTFFAGTTELDAFALTNAVEARDATAALGLARRIGLQGLRNERGRLDDGEGSAHRALAMLGSSVKRLFDLRVLMESGLDPAAALRELGMNPSRAPFLAAAARRYSLRELRHALSTLAGALRSAHDTGGDIRLALETAVVAIAGRRP